MWVMMVCSAIVDMWHCVLFVACWACQRWLCVNLCDQTGNYSLMFPNSMCLCILLQSWGPVVYICFDTLKFPNCKTLFRVLCILQVVTELVIEDRWFKECERCIGLCLTYFVDRIVAEDAPGMWFQFLIDGGFLISQVLG